MSESSLERAVDLEEHEALRRQLLAVSDEPKLSGPASAQLKKFE